MYLSFIFFSFLKANKGRAATLIWNLVFVHGLPFFRKKIMNLLTSLQIGLRGSIFPGQNNRTCFMTKGSGHISHGHMWPVPQKPHKEQEVFQTGCNRAISCKHWPCPRGGDYYRLGPHLALPSPEGKQDYEAILFQNSQLGDGEWYQRKHETSSLPLMF